jgi:DNA (cytosine-5)-methyltransferase 1
MKPRLLDLFCGAGGAGRGYELAGWEVVGVDIAAQPNCPFKFIRADALEVLGEHWITFDGRFDAIHASPPCQHFTAYGRSVKDIKDRYEDLLAPTRELLQQTGLPYVIENVVGAPMNDPLLLCGSMFDMDIQRHRLFETNWPVEPPVWPCRHGIWGPNRYPGGRWKARKENDPTITPSTPVRNSMEIGRWNINLEKQKQAMGVDWKIDVRELSEAIPPAYTQFVGEQLLAHVQSVAA